MTVTAPPVNTSIPSSQLLILPDILSEFIYSVLKIQKYFFVFPVR